MLAYYVLLVGWAGLAVVLDAGSEGSSQKARNAFVYIAAATLFLLMSLRSTTVGTDLEGYRWQYDTQFLRPEEPGYSLLIVLCRQMGLSFQQFLAVVSLIIVAAVSALIRELAMAPFLSFFLHVTLGFFAMSLSGLRQSLAVAVCILAFLALNRLRWIASLVLTAVACSFHNSAFVFFLTPLFFRLRPTRRASLVLMIIPMVVLLLQAYVKIPSNLLPIDRYNSYLDEAQVSPNPLSILVAGAIAMVCILFWQPTELVSTTSVRVSERTMSVLIVMSLCNFLVMAMSTKLLIFTRFSYYFLPYIAILIPNVITTAKHVWMRAIGPLVTLSIAAAQFAITTPGGVLGIGRYAFFWEGK